MLGPDVDVVRYYKRGTDEVGYRLEVHERPLYARLLRELEVHVCRSIGCGAPWARGDVLGYAGFWVCRRLSRVVYRTSPRPVYSAELEAHHAKALLRSLREPV